MNFYSEHNAKIDNDVHELLGMDSQGSKRINFAVSYSQNRKLSVVVIEVSPSTIIHSLVFFYTRGLTLLDAWRYRNRQFQRIPRGGDSLQRIDRLNKFILMMIPEYAPVGPRRISEADSVTTADNDRKDQQIQRLKDRIRVEQDISRGLRNQIKTLRANQKREREKPHE
jgi:hypothetical protein